MYRILILITVFLVASATMLFVQGGKTRDPAELPLAVFSEVDLDGVAALTAPTNEAVPAPPSTGARALAAAEAAVAPAAEVDNPEMAAATARVLDNLRRARGLAPVSGAAPGAPITQALTRSETDAYVEKLVDEALTSSPAVASDAPEPAAQSPEAVAATLPAPSPEPAVRTYTVQKGDSLGSIARAFYGDGLQYLKIFEANRHILETPNHLEAGQELTIPPAS